MKIESLIQPEKLFFRDDGGIPNSTLPALLYRQPFAFDTPDLAAILENCFTANDWTGAWRGNVYDYHHYHSTSHEVLGVFQGSARLQLGGERGAEYEIRCGDVLVIPAGVGHKRITERNAFRVVGAYPEGRDWDILRGLSGERPEADRRIAAVPLPENDPLYGESGPLKKIWR